MQHVDCTGYPVIGWLIHTSLDKVQSISRTTLASTAKGSINLYCHQGTFILECDTNGDHDPNDYFFFKPSEQAEILAATNKMVTNICLDCALSEQAVQHAIDYLQKR